MTHKIPVTDAQAASEHIIILAPEFAAYFADATLSSPTSNDAPDDMYWAADDAPAPGIAYDPDGPCDPSLAAYLDDLTDHGITIVWPVGVAVASLAADGCDVLYFRFGCGYHRYEPYYYIEAGEAQHVTVMCAPRPATEIKQRQVQQINHDTFVGVMAEMVKKYASKVVEHKEM